jgi:kynureninase
LIGAGKGEVVAADSTSINLFKALSVALGMNPGRRLVVSEKSNFPTDLYVLEGVIAQLGRDLELVLVDGTDEAVEAILAERGREIGVVLLTHIHYTTARMYDMRRVTSAVHAQGGVIVWDLSHSAGIVPVDLDGCDADFAVGCGYKYLNGGPGAPAFIYVARRLQDRFTQPISGWMGDARPFEFRAGYEPAAGIDRYLSGTPPVIAMAGLEASVELLLEAPMEAIRRKSVALCDLFIELVDRHCADLGLELVSPARKHVAREPPVVPACGQPIRHASVDSRRCRRRSPPTRPDPLRIRAALLASCGHLGRGHANGGNPASITASSSLTARHAFFP